MCIRDRLLSDACDGQALRVDGGGYPGSPKRARLARDADEFDVILPWQSSREVKVLAVHRFFHPSEQLTVSRDGGAMPSQASPGTMIICIYNIYGVLSQ